MTNQPDERWLKKAEELLPCSGLCPKERLPNGITHFMFCPAHYRETFARALQEAFDERYHWEHEHDEPEGEP